MRYGIVGTGSSANSYIFEAQSGLYIIDNGFSLKEFKSRVSKLGFNYTDIKGIFLTHNHGDHMKGVSSLSKDLEIPVYAHKFLKGDFFKHIKIEPEQHYTLDGMDVMPFELSHDAPNSIGFYFKIGDTRFTLITDTGLITPKMYFLAKRSNILFLEANYSVDMLKSSDYPVFLKNRILSSRGHLSNADAIKFLNDLAADEQNINIVYLCHLSKNCNSVDELENCFINNYKGDIPYRICQRDEYIIPEVVNRPDMVKITSD